VKADNCLPNDFKNIVGGKDYTVDSLHFAVNEFEVMAVGGQLTPNEGDAPGEAYAYFVEYQTC